jgi:hypothetical protein
MHRFRRFSFPEQLLLKRWLHDGHGRRGCLFLNGHGSLFLLHFGRIDGEPPCGYVFESGQVLLYRRLEFHLFIFEPGRGKVLLNGRCELRAAAVAKRLSLVEPGAPRVVPELRAAAVAKRLSLVEPDVPRVVPELGGAGRIGEPARGHIHEPCQIIIGSLH